MASQIQIWDYIIIISTLIISAIFGLYNGCYKAKNSTLFEYVLGSRTMPLIPIAISSFATIVATGMMIGYPSQMYFYGIGAMATILNWVFLIPLTNYLAIPVYRQLKNGNIFEVNLINKMSIYFLFSMF